MASPKKKMAVPQSKYIHVFAPLKIIRSQDRQSLTFTVHITEFTLMTFQASGSRLLEEAFAAHQQS
jgi:hypothetical protein